MICHLARRYSVIAGQQGSLGEAAVAAGATGYECGIGWRERCDLRAAMGSHRRVPPGGSARPVYIATLSGDPEGIGAQLNHQGIAAGLICLDA